MRVLIVEDNPPDAALVRTLLKDANADTEVRIAERVTDAVTMLALETFDAVILDMTLPDARGLDALRRIRKQAPRLPIVILSGQDDEQLALAAVKDGAQDYLIKGQVVEVSLLRSLRYAVERQRLSDRLAASIGELENQRANVIHANQLKDELISALAHDLKGPLTSIVGFAQLIEEGALDGADARDGARTIAKNAGRLTTLANDTLTMSRVEFGELELSEDPIDIPELLGEIVGRMAKTRDVRLTVGEGDAHVPGDRERLRQVFENVIGNALKYSSDTVDVDVRSDDEWLRVAVRDLGIGIPQNEVANIFTRFVRGSNARTAKVPGTGVGLFLVDSLVDQHGGRIDVTSVLDGGSTFTVILPKEAARNRTPSIAVIGSDATVGPFIAYELRSRGYRVRHAALLEELLTARNRESYAVAIVANDLVREGSVAIRPLLASVSSKIIGVGASSDDLGWDGHLPRAFLTSDLHAAVEKTLGKSER
jgi:signal transduction histidine kinase